jgi:hypothetical protein
METQIDFEEWAKLLLTRKLPENFSYLIGSELIHSGADILKRGEAFEVHLEGQSSPTVSTPRVFVTQIPHLVRASAN